MIFIYCNWNSTRWQWSVNFYIIGKGYLYPYGETIQKAIQKHRMQKIENKNTKEKKNIKIILKL